MSSEYYFVIDNATLQIFFTPRYVSYLPLNLLFIFSINIGEWSKHSNDIGLHKTPVTIDKKEIIDVFKESE